MKKYYVATRLLPPEPTSMNYYLPSHDRWALVSLIPRLFLFFFFFLLCAISVSKQKIKFYNTQKIELSA